MTTLNERPTVGQQVTVIYRRRDYQAEQRSATYSRVFVDERATGIVTKVGRKYVTVETRISGSSFPRSSEFAWAEGRAKDPCGNDRTRMFTAAGLLAHDRLTAARQVIEDAGCKLTRLNGAGLPDLTVDQWEAVAAAVSP